MNPFIIRTGFPFGYLIAYGFLTCLGVLGVWLVAVGLWRRQGKRLVVGVVSLVFSVYVFAVNIAADGAVDMNPSIGSGVALVGRWSAVSGEILIFAADGTYHCVGGRECADLMATGVWRVSGGLSDVELRPSSSSSFSLVFSVVKYQGRLRLAHYIEDPDTWDGEMPFTLVAPLG